MTLEQKLLIFAENCIKSAEQEVLDAKAVRNGIKEVIAFGSKAQKELLLKRLGDKRPDLLPADPEDLH